MSILDEMQHKVAMASRYTDGKRPVAVVVSADVWNQAKAETRALAYTQVTSGGDTFMGLPVEIVEGANMISVRTEPAEKSGGQPSEESGGLESAEPERPKT